MFAGHSMLCPYDCNPEKRPAGRRAVPGTTVLSLGVTRVPDECTFPASGGARRACYCLGCSKFQHVVTEDQSE